MKQLFMVCRIVVAPAVLFVGFLLPMPPLVPTAWADQTSQSIIDFDDIPANSRSSTLNRSSAQWQYTPNTDYDNDNLDRWISTGNGDGISNYENGYNSPNMGFTCMGFWEIDDQETIKGNSLEIHITGGYNSTHMPPNAAGLAIHNKAEYIANTKPFTNAVVGDPYLYITDAAFYPNSGTIVPPFAAAKNANRLTFYAKDSVGGNVDLGSGHPEPPWSIGPYSNVDARTGAIQGETGHFYNSPVVGGKGWMKIQVDGHPDWNNQQIKPPRNLPNFIQQIYGFYISYGLDPDGTHMTEWTLRLDEIGFENDSYGPQNEETINNIGLEYDPATRTGEIGFQDKYQDSIYFSKAMATYELRYSFSLITNENWSSATPVHIQAYSNWGIADRMDGRFQRVSNDAYTSVWAPFKLASAADEDTLLTNKHIYFAVKDVSQNPSNLRQINPGLTGSVAGQGRDYSSTNVFYDYNVDATNLPYIKRIDYLLPGANVPPPTNNPPTVTLTSPVTGATFTAPATVTLTATASDSDGTIAKVEFYNGATLLGTSSTAPYTLTWNAVPAGSYSLTAKGTDNAGASTTSSAMTITVTRKNVPPLVRMKSPKNGATFTAPATVTLKANAWDPDGTIAKVEFYNGATLLGTSSTAPYTLTWNAVPAGSYSLTAKATDNGGASRVSRPVNITVTRRHGRTG